MPMHPAAGPAPSRGWGSGWGARESGRPLTRGRPPFSSSSHLTLRRGGSNAAKLLSMEGHDIALIQEHKLHGEQKRRSAAALAARAGWVLRAQEAEAGPSGGAGILTRRHVHMGPLPHKGKHANRWAPYHLALKGVDVVVISVYGYSGDGDGPHNRALIHELAEYAAGLGRVKLLAAGDWNMTPEQFPNAGGWKLGTALPPDIPTCHASKGLPTKYDYWVANTPARQLVKGWRVIEGTPVPTHEANEITLDASTQLAVPDLWRPLRIPARIIGCVREPPWWAAKYPTAGAAAEDLDRAARDWARAAQQEALHLAG